jgi:hypothetical protein
MYTPLMPAVIGVVYLLEGFDMSLIKLGANDYQG